MDFFSRLFRSDFMPHGHCFFWKPEILWPSVGSDLIIALSYYSIPAALVHFVRKRKDLAFNWMFLMFGAFILACGTTHAMGIWTVWNGTYRVDALIKSITATCWPTRGSAGRSRGSRWWISPTRSRSAGTRSGPPSKRAAP